MFGFVGRRKQNANENKKLLEDEKEHDHLSDDRIHNDHGTYKFTSKLPFKDMYEGRDLVMQTNDSRNQVLNILKSGRNTIKNIKITRCHDKRTYDNKSWFFHDSKSYYTLSNLAQYAASSPRFKNNVVVTIVDKQLSEEQGYEVSYDVDARIIVVDPIVELNGTDHIPLPFGRGDLMMQTKDCHLEV